MFICIVFFLCIFTLLNVQDTEIFWFLCFAIRDGGDWEDTTECIQLSETECDLTHYFRPFDRYGLGLFDYTLEST